MGAGAGWADAMDETSRDAAVTTRNLENGIKVTGLKIRDRRVGKA
jgi:hypothetical protein